MKRDQAPKNNELENSLKSDLLGRNIYLRNLIGMIPTISEHTVLALDGRWGSGKTFFIKQLEYLINNHNNNYTNIDNRSVSKLNELFSFFYFNAWENDHLPPVEAILLRLSGQLWSNEEKLGDKALGIIKGITNIPIKYFSGGSADLESFKSAYLSAFIERAKHISKTNEEIDNLLHNHRNNTGKKVLFIIDDLDRCRPTFAVELLEAIKHSFNSNNALFIICANNEQLQYTIKKYYGESFNGYEYLDRFYDLVINLPEPDVERYIKYGLRLKDPDYWHNQIAIDIAKIDHMSLRQANRYISSLLLLEDFIKSQNLNLGVKSENYVKSVFIQIAAALKILDKKKFDDFTTGNGEYILNEYYQKSDEIRSFTRVNKGEELPIKTQYLEIFNTRSSYNPDREIFRNAISLIGFSTIIDEEPDKNNSLYDN